MAILGVRPPGIGHFVVQGGTLAFTLKKGKSCMKSSIAYLGVFLAGIAILLGPGLSLNAQPAQAATSTIAPGAAGGPTTVAAGDTLIIEQGSSVELALTNYGTVINRGMVSGTIANEGPGVVVNEETGTLQVLMQNYGTLENRGTFASPQTGTFENYGHVVNRGYFDSHTMNVVNLGSFDNMQGGTFFMFNGVGFGNNGTLNNSGTFYLSKTTRLVNEGAVNNGLEGQLYVGGYGTGSGSAFTNEAGATVNNRGNLTNHDFFFNKGTFNNYGTLSNRPVGLLNPLFNNTGTLNNNAGGTILNLDDSARPGPVAIKNFDTLNNSASIVNEGTDAAITNECGGTFNNSGPVTGNPVVYSCAAPSHSGQVGSLLKLGTGVKVAVTP
jgi:hypothetical protein